ncbi:P-loop containing nucleoside triphosphate hydrolase protein [Gautieria morchelliformis]|nr:P-loop containing nucleoside triphosphate hydrolase protein [Gautieria morchelliformis]
MVRVCPNLSSLGACTTEGCVFNHDIHLCQTCGVVCISADWLKTHLSGKKHARRVRAQTCPHPPFCKLCNVSLGSPWNYPQHIKGRSHQALLEEQQAGQVGSDTESESASLFVPRGHSHCHVCDLALQERFWSSHITGFAHRQKERFTAIQAAFNEADEDKHGITVSSERGEGGPIDFGFIESDSLLARPTHSTQVTVHLTTPGNIQVSEIRLSSSMASRPLPRNFFLGPTTCPVQLSFKKPLDFTVTFDPSGLPGRSNDRVEIVFVDMALQTQFVITRPLLAVVGNKADLDLVKPSSPYTPKIRTKQEPEKDITPGIKPPQLADINWTVSLPQAFIPPRLEAILNNQRGVILVQNLKVSWLPGTLNSETYGRHFKVLIHVEEAQMNIDIQRYDEEDVPMEPVLSFYRLPVPGLAEKRPSVIVGDRILVQRQGSKSSGRWFEGFVHRVRLNDVDLKFHSSFHSYSGQKYNVRFKVGRLPLRRMHQALGTAFTSDRVLFPGEAHIMSRVVTTDAEMMRIRCVNRSIESNPPQLQAVASILHMPRGSVPFVVFGPPGTGKTVTIVEAMRQIILKDPDARILACAPSNSAADLIAERLKESLLPPQLFRLNAPSRSKDQMPKSLQQFSLTNNDGTFTIPRLEKLSQFRVIVSTCISASVPYGIGIPRGHFTHIFIDEAGQACEPEAMIPIKTMADNMTNIVLSGDPKQLGPIIRSKVALELGLGKSYLDRLMARDIYEVTRGSGISIVKLIKNWRSHEAILEYPNQEFYRGELEPHGDRVVTHSLLRSDELVTVGFPVVFHAIAGQDMREGNSPSFFNGHEASLVKQYVDSLRTDQRLRLKDEHIGVITPYHAQAMKIRTLLKKKNYSGVKTGSVEEFQGQERRAIIISTVRSTIGFVEYDIKHTLGFVANPRRFNVAVTRAQALLILVGDPSILALDPLWRGFLNYIYNNGGWRGLEPDWDTDEPIRPEGGYDVDRRKAAETEMENLIERTKSLIIENSERLGTQGGDDGDGEAQVDRPWREAE